MIIFDIAEWRFWKLLTIDIGDMQNTKLDFNRLLVNNIRTFLYLNIIKYQSISSKFIGFCHPLHFWVMSKSPNISLEMGQNQMVTEDDNDYDTNDNNNYDNPKKTRTPKQRCCAHLERLSGLLNEGFSSHTQM